MTEYEKMVQLVKELSPHLMGHGGIIMLGVGEEAGKIVLDVGLEEENPPMKDWLHRFLGTTPHRIEIIGPVEAAGATA